MAITNKPIDANEVVEHIPAIEKNAENPTTIYYKPMTKRENDKFISKLMTVKGTKTVDHTDEAAEILFKQQLTSKEGVFIQNVIIDNKLTGICDLGQAVKWLMSLRGENLAVANDLEREIRGMSTLDETETKNSSGQ
jgi:hypothetical protein